MFSVTNGAYGGYISQLLETTTMTMMMMVLVVKRNCYFL
jgi:hypothetical protein